MDKLSMQKMIFYGYHGVFPEENKLGQQFIVDTTLYLDLKSAGEMDELHLTVNYAEMYSMIKQIVEGPPVKLIEALAERLAAAILNAYTIVEEVSVTVTKPHPPVDIHFDGVSVQIHRKRAIH